MQEASSLNGKLWHFPDGPLHKARDAAMKPETRGCSLVIVLISGGIPQRRCGVMAMMLSWRLIGLGLERGNDRLEVRMKLYVWAYRTDLIAVVDIIHKTE
jgi:hypothetical protein